MLAMSLGVSYKCAFVLCHKLREAMAEEMKGRTLGGDGKVAEVDGGYFGGYRKPANLAENRVDRRLARYQTGKRKAVIIIRERNGRSLPAVFRTEGQALSFVRSRIAKGTIINADESGSWDELHAQYEMKRINHRGSLFDGRRLHELGRGIFQPNAPGRTGAPSPHRRSPFASLCARSFMARRSSPDQQWRTGPHDFWLGDETRAICRFLRILAALRVYKIICPLSFHLRKNDINYLGLFFFA